jgi:Xaa-Pro aminopeptidase
MNKLQNLVINIWDKVIMTAWERYQIGVIKSPKEIEKIKEACNITDEIFKNVIENFNFKTEIELRDYIFLEIKRRGFKPAFPPIVSSASRAGNEIHPSSKDEKLEGFVIIDMGVRYKGFCSDMTRTVFVGEPTNF